MAKALGKAKETFTTAFIASISSFAMQKYADNKSQTETCERHDNLVVRVII